MSNPPATLQNNRWTCPLCKHKNEVIACEWSYREVQCQRCYKKFLVVAGAKKNN